MDNDRIAGSAKDFASKVEGAVGSIAGTQAGGVAREATETLRDGSQAVAKKLEDYPLGALLVAVGVGFALALLMAGTQDRRAPQHWSDYWDRDRDRGRERDRDRGRDR